ncbi:MAG: SLC13 family permease [Pseudomonadota bacterium]
MDGSPSLAKQIGLWLGPVAAGIMLLIGAPEGLSFSAWATGALMVWMAVWWATEPIPIPVTSLLPLVVIPLIGAGSAREAAAGYSSPIVMLLLGGFIIALGIERWGLHKRIALNIVANVGSRPASLIFGFMIATALLSMWISNTATTLMMVPIALSAAAALKDDSGKFVTALLLGVCYAASIGGVATPIGTPTNLIAIQWLEENTGTTIGYAQWMSFGLPALALLIPVAWWVVSRSLPKLGDGREAMAEIRQQRDALGSISAPEARAAMVFGIVACLWVLRVPAQLAAENAGWEAPWLMAVGDMGIAIAGAIAMFLVPAGRSQKRAILRWDEAVKLPWGVLVLFGGGISLGQAVTRTGMSTWIGDQLTTLSVLPPIFFIAIVVALVIFLTELTSNVATMTTLAPILGALAGAIGAAPESLLAPAAVAASCAFMLPVATAPNAIIYATDKVPIAQMIQRGVRINLFGILIITAIGFWLAPMVL